jgi:hypothetical protein
MHRILESQLDALVRCTDEALDANRAS